MSDKTSDKLLKCPFCNKELEQKGNFFYKHPTDGECILSNFSVCNRPKDIEAWNTRKPVGYAVEALKKPIWIEHTDDLTLNEIAETAIKQTREVAIERVKEIMNAGN